MTATTITEMPVLALRPKEAAKALGVSQKHLYNISAPRGDLPCVKSGKAILYEVADLRQWLASKKITATPNRPPAALKNSAGGGETTACSSRLPTREGVE